MDMFARLSVLEGAAGAIPGSWVRKAAEGMGDALNYFGAGLHPDWTSMRDLQVYRTALAAARRALSGSSGTDPEELIQALNKRASDPSGGSRHRLFYSVGQALSHATDLSKGLVGPGHLLVSSTLSSWVTGSAQGVIASWKSTQTPIVKSLPGDSRYRSVAEADVTPQQKIETLESVMGTRLAKKHNHEEDHDDDVEAAQDKESELTDAQTPLVPNSSVLDWARSGKDYHTWRDQHTRDTGGYMHLASHVAGRWVEKVAGLDGTLEDRVAKIWAARKAKDS
jgi:hypothetical protein